MGIAMLMVSVLVFCISSKRSADGCLQWNLVEMEKALSKSLCFIIMEERVIGQKSLPARKPHFNTYKTFPIPRQYPPEHSCYKGINTALHIASVLALRWRVNLIWTVRNQTGATTVWSDEECVLVSGRNLYPWERLLCRAKNQCVFWQWYPIHKCFLWTRCGVYSVRVYVLLVLKEPSGHNWTQQTALYGRRWTPFVLQLNTSKI